MEYKLALALKKAGFPFKMNECDTPQCSCEINMLDGGYLIPTLKELIKACGDDFISLTKNGDNWYVDSGCIGIFQIKSKTPEIAVAKLWLEINK